jgi:succinate dehydrogenase / fumarate reductase membrane anchor subunit
MSLRSPLGRVRGLGSAKEGVNHFWAQRMTALALIPLSVWFVISLLSVLGADYWAVKAWVSSPVVAGLLILLIAATFYHAFLGLQVVIEDYIHGEGLKLLTLVTVKGAAWLLAIIGVVSVLVLLLGETPA